MEHAVLAVFGRDHELVAGVAADRPALGLDGQIVEPAAGEDAAIRGIHLVVALVERFHRGVEAVGVFHQELAGAKHAEPRPLLVAELRRDLIERDRHLPVAVDLPRHQVGDDLLVRGAEHDVDLPAGPVEGQLHEHLAEGGHPARLLPERPAARWPAWPVRRPRRRPFPRARCVRPSARPAGPAADRYTLRPSPG